MRHFTRAKPGSPDRESAPAVALSGMFAVTGAIHLLRPSVFDPIVPRCLPGPSRLWTVVSGLAEWALAALAWNRSSRNLAGLLAAVFLLAVFPANVRTVRVLRRKAWPARLAALARLPLQLPLIALALRVGRGSR